MLCNIYIQQDFPHVYACVLKLETKCMRTLSICANTCLSCLLVEKINASEMNLILQNMLSAFPNTSETKTLNFS